MMSFTTAHATVLVALAAYESMLVTTHHGISKPVLGCSIVTVITSVDWDIK